nr:hypothetical protein Iba_chr13bCG4080 [Ipomoea batatas]GMD77665.1 hypothetical protein Iba_chr13cCG5570 [Ipomoea batatas]
MNTCRVQLEIRSALNIKLPIPQGGQQSHVYKGYKIKYRDEDGEKKDTIYQITDATDEDIESIDRDQMS